MYGYRKPPLLTARKMAQHRTTKRQPKQALHQEEQKTGNAYPLQPGTQLALSRRCGFGLLFGGKGVFTAAFHLPGKGKMQPR